MSLKVSFAQVQVRMRRLLGGELFEKGLMTKSSWVAARIYQGFVLLERVWRLVYSHLHTQSLQVPR